MPSCFVVGEGIVPLRCLEILGRRGFDVRGVYSGDGSLRPLCDKSGYPHAPSLDAFKTRLGEVDHDFLFSINNGWVIPDAVAARARRAAINFHDSPLPKYAGLHATSWALLHGERDHAITWHEVTAQIDGGRVYKRRSMPVAPEDTAFTLNTRCFEAAIASFEELAAELATGTERRVAQPEAGRSYFGLRDRPRAACAIFFAKPAAAIVDLVRALDFGPPRNPLGLPKIRTAAGFVTVSAATAHDEATAGAPGRIVRVGADGVRVGTLTGDVTLGGFRTLAGASIGESELRAAFGITEGAVLSDPSDDEAEAITRFYGGICAHERGWARRLAALAPFKHPYASQPSGGAPSRTPLGELAALVAHVPNAERAAKVLAIAAAYAARVATEPVIDLGLSGAAQRGPSAELFAPIVPIRVERAEGTSFEQLETSVRAELARAGRMGTYARDVHPRYPDLRTSVPVRLPFTLACAAAPDALAIDALDTDVLVAVYDDGSAPEIVDRGALAPWQRDAIGRQITCLAREALDAPETPVTRMPLLDAEERERLLVAWNRTAAPFPADSVHALVAAQAARTPDASAVRFGGASLSYAALDRRSNQLARELRARGVARGMRVALCLRRSAELVVGLLGILKAGAAYVPIDPTYPPGRVAHMIGDSGAAAVVTDRALRGAFFADHANALCLDDDRAAIDAQSGAPIDDGVTPDDIAYVIYTSGSTGAPKGVEIPHAGLVNHSTAIAANYALGPGDRLLCSASISFDVAGEQIYPALFRGAEVVVRPDDLFDSFARFDRFVRDEAITTMILPTAFWHEWVRELERSDAGVPPALRALSTGTEKVDAEHLASWQARSGGRVRFFQGYGPTETTVTCTMYVHDGSPVDAGRTVPIGRPLPNTEIYLLDDAREPVPVGMPGEIYVGGVGLARGYLGRPELTAEKFVTHPWREGARLYCTGDLAQYEPDGQIVYLGRRDFQVKVRGFRVELGEIEAVLRQLEGVDDAAVVLREDGGNKRLVAYVVARGGADVSGLRDFAAARLPEYMVPAAVVTLDAFPMTPNQKIDRRALPPPPDAPRAVMAPRTPLEQTIAAIWAEELRRIPASFGVTDDFFALGGDSLSAVGMLSAIEAKVGASVPLSAFTRAPTIEGLAAHVSSPESAGEEPLVVVLQEGRADRPPLWLIHPVGGHVVFGQWLREHMSPEQRILGIQARGLDGKRAPLTTVEEMAELYVDLVRQTQPEGPYLVAGPSMGGFIAIEMVRRLRALGCDVRVFALLDAWGPSYPRPTSTIVRWMDSARFLAGIPTWRERFEQIHARLRNGRSGAPTRADAPPRIDVLHGLGAARREPGALVRAIEEVTRANEQANDAYRPRPFDVPVFLVRALDGMRWSGMRFDDPTNGWGPFALGGIRTVTIACDHLALVDRPPPAVGRALQREIDTSLARPCS